MLYQYSTFVQEAIKRLRTQQDSPRKLARALEHLTVAQHLLEQYEQWLQEDRRLLADYERRLSLQEHARVLQERERTQQPYPLW